MLQMERHGVVEYRFAGHSLLQDARAVFRYLRRIERMAANAGNSDCIDIALVAGLHGPKHVVAVENIDVFINQNDVLQFREG